MRSGRGTTCVTDGCQAELPKTSENTIFSNKNTHKMLIIRQIDWREVGWPLSCNAFVIARFLVELFSLAVRAEVLRATIDCKSLF